MKMRMLLVLCAAGFLLSVGCRSATQENPSPASSQPEPASKPPARASTNELRRYAAMGKIERFHSKLGDLIASDAAIERLAEGFDWSEGPVWMKKGKYLLFSDVPSNVVYMWREGEGITQF